MNNKTFFLLALSIIITSCSNTNPKTEMENKEHGIILSNMDTTVSPRDDFYNFVNGNWDKKTVIPEDQVRWGGFGVLRKSTDKDVLEILDKAAKSGKSCSMDEKKSCDKDKKASCCAKKTDKKDK